MFENTLDPVSISDAAGAHLQLSFDRPAPATQDWGEFAPHTEAESPRPYRDNAARWHPEYDSLEAMMDRDPSLRRWIFTANYAQGGV